MKKIRPDDNRYDIIRKFDDCMVEFFARTTGFCEEAERIVNSDEDNSKVYLLAMGLMMDLQIVYDNAVTYCEEIKNSMLDIRIDENLKFKKSMEERLVSFRKMVESMINCGSLGVDYNEMNDKINNDEEVSIEMTDTTDIQLFSRNLSKNLADKTIPIFEYISNVVAYLDGMFVELTTLNKTRTDDDYRNIYDISFEKYKASDRWIVYRDRYLPTRIQENYDGKIEKMTSQSFDFEIKRILNRIHGDIDLEEVWTSYSDSALETCKYFVSKEMKDDSVIQRYFRNVAIIDHINEQKIYFEKNIIRVGQDSLLAKKVQFIKPYSEYRLLAAWPDIIDYMGDSGKAYGIRWCCLHHALAFDKRINNVRFSTFMRWFMKFVKVNDLISESNLSQCASNYFVVTTSAQWSEMKYKEYIESGKDKSRKGKNHYNDAENGRTFERMYMTAEKLRQILKKHS